MLFIYTVFQYAVCAVIFVWSFMTALRNRHASPPLVLTTAGLLLLLIVQLIMGVVMWSTQSGTDPILFFGYALTAIAVVLASGYWAFAELSKWGPLVLVVSSFTAFIMVFRMDQIWQ